MCLGLKLCDEGPFTSKSVAPRVRGCPVGVHLRWTAICDTLQYSETLVGYMTLTLPTIIVPTVDSESKDEQEGWPGETEVGIQGDV